MVVPTQLAIATRRIAAPGSCAPFVLSSVSQISHTMVSEYQLAG
jgi:hypothetical protein